MENKKLSKKELEAIQSEKRKLRYEFQRAVRTFWEERSAAETYFKTKGERLPEGEEERLFRRHEILNDYKLSYDNNSPESRMWSTIRIIVNNDRTNRDYRGKEVDEYFSTRMEEDDIIINDIVWDENEIKLILSQLLKFGYKRIFYKDHSTAVMRTVVGLINFGAKIEDTFFISQYGDVGLIFNIENVKLEEEEIEDELVINDIKNIIDSIEGVEYSWGYETALGKVISKYRKQYKWTQLEKLVSKLILNKKNELKKRKEAVEC